LAVFIRFDRRPIFPRRMRARAPAEDDIKTLNDNIAELRAPFEARNP
jgi:hypothetical protein